MFPKRRSPESSFIKYPPVSYHFQVVFFSEGTVPNSFDIRFQKVSGLSSTMKTQEIVEGGETLFTHLLPGGVRYSNLLLERGLVMGSGLNVEFEAAMRAFQLNPGDVLISLLNENSLPISAWCFINAYPVSWSLSDLDANSNSVAIETMELAYTRFRRVKVE